MRNKKFYTTAVFAMILYLVLCSVSFANVIGEPPQFSPILTEPQHGSTEVSLTPDIKWGEVPGATYYRLEISKSAGPSWEVVYDEFINDTKITLPEALLRVSTLYSWRVMAYNEFGGSPWSDEFIFTTTEHSFILSYETNSNGIKGGQPEMAPELLIPENNSTSVELTPDLIWASMEGVTGYRLEFNILIKNGPAVLMDTLIADNKFRLQEGYLSLNTTYYWRVSGHNEYGYGPWSEYYSFTTTEHSLTGSFFKVLKGNKDRAGEPEYSPVLITPVDNSINVPLTVDLTWDGVEMANLYRLVIAKLPENTTVLDIYSEDLKYRIPEGILDNGCTYTWTVCGVNSNGSGPYATPFTFTTKGHSLYENDVQSENKLLNNYPNPFNPVTKIAFILAKNTFVKIKVYDMLGREVKVLVNGMMNAGTHAVEFNASNLASGIYVYKMEAGEFKSVKKMMLIK